jgi:putative membrane protein
MYGTWGYSLFGMYWLWWIFWLLAIALVFGFAQPIPRRRLREYRDQSPLARLQRRYAEGEISTQEYEERRAILERDRARDALPTAPTNAPPISANRTAPQPH